MVKNDLDEFFAAINIEAQKKGLEWSTIDGHYWLELRINSAKKESDAGPTPPATRATIKSKIIHLLDENDIKINDALLRQV